MKVFTRSSALALCLLPLAFSTGFQPSGPFGGSVTVIAVDPSNAKTLLIGTRNSSVFQSLDAGQSWSRLPFPRDVMGVVGTLVIDPNNPRLYYAGLSVDRGRQGGLFISNDAGRTWARSPGLDGLSVNHVAVFAKDTKRVAAATSAGVWLSEDGAATWNRISPVANQEMIGMTVVAFAPNDGNVIYAGTSHLPWKTPDSGKTWISIHNGMVDDSDIFSMWIDPTNPSRVYASACSGIYKSEDAGLLWSKYKGIPFTHRRTHVIRPDPNDPKIVYAGTTLGLFKSVDGGLTFQLLNGFHILNMAFDPSNPKSFYMATANAGLLRSDDGGKTAIPLNSGFQNRRVAAYARAGKNIFVNTIQEGDSGGIYRSEDGGKSWRQATSASVLGDQHLGLMASFANDPSTVFAAGDKTFLKSVDGGKTWTRLIFATPAKLGTVRLTALAALQQAQPVLLVGTDKGLYRSADRGATFQPVGLKTVTAPSPVAAPRPAAIKPAGPAGAARPRAAAAKAAAPAVTILPVSVQTLRISANQQRILVLADEALYLSNDSGRTWEEYPAPVPSGLIYDLALSDDAAQPLLLATARGLFRQDSASSGWSQEASGIETATLQSVAYRPGEGSQALAAQFGRLYESRDGGRTWAPVEGGAIEDASIRRLGFHPDYPERVFALTPDLGVFYLDLPVNR